MSEKDLGKESMVLKNTPEALDNRGSEGVLDGNELIQNELMRGLNHKLPAESNDQSGESVEPITSEYLKGIKRRNPINSSVW